MKERNRIGIVFFLAAFGVITTKNYSMDKDVWIETRDKASKNAWSFEFYSKSKTKLLLTVTKLPGEILLEHEIMPGKKIRAMYRDPHDKIQLEFDGKQFVIMPKPGETVYVTYDGERLRPQTGVLGGILGVTDSGLDNRKNIQASAIEKIIEKTEKPADIKKKHLTVQLFDLVKEKNVKNMNKIEDLIKKEGVDPNTKDIENFTPLFYAYQDPITGVSVSIATALLALGTDTNITYRHKKENLSLLQIRLSDPSTINATLTTNMKAHNFVTMIRNLLDYNANPNVTNNKGNAPLYFAVQLKIGETSSLYTEWLISAFVRQGAKVNHQNKEGDTALHEAVRQNNTKAVEILIKKGNADYNVKNNNGKSPYDLALESNNPNILQYFEQHENVELLKKTE